MAAASNKPGAVHYALVFFVMVSVILGIFSYMNHREFSDKSAQFADKDAEVAKMKAAVKSGDDQIQALKKEIGRLFDVTLNNANIGDPNTVVGAAQKDRADFGKTLAGTNYAETLQKMREAIDAAIADRDSKAAQVAALEKELKEERDRLNQRVETANKAQSKSETEKLDVVSTQDERLKAKQEEIDRLKTDNNALQAELNQVREAWEKDARGKTQEIANLENRIQFLGDKIDNLEKLSFEVPDGLIQRVDNTSRLVWINLGSADYLKPRITFSVYSKENHGVGRGAEDVKGKIEVTRILGAHLAEARITEDDIVRPMLANDLIYTPAWSPGLVEKIAFAGLIDMDSDGKSDWDEMLQILSTSGASVDTYVNDEGERLPENSKISVHTKFLVLGYIPEPDQVVTDEEKKTVALVRKHQNEMLKEARVNGVRTIKLNDFLAFIGYESKRRTFRPGQERPYNLKAGSSSAATSEPVNDRISSGNVSGAFGPGRKSAPQQTSDGHTSKLFSPSGR